MKALFAIAMTLSLFSSYAEAGRPDTLKMTCGEAREILEEAGSLTMNTGPYVYHRYKAYSGNYIAYVPTRDTENCKLGFLDHTPLPTDSASSEYRVEAPKSVCNDGDRRKTSLSSEEIERGVESFYRICVKGRWRRESPAGVQNAKGSGISVIGASYQP